MRIEIDPEQLKAAKDKVAHIKNGANTALMRALNKTMAKSKTLASREIGNQLNLPISKIKEKLPIKKARKDDLNAKLSAQKRGLLMNNFVTNLAQARKGRPVNRVRVKVKKSGATITISSAFYIMTRNSNVLTPAVRNEVLIRQGMKHEISGNLTYTVLHGPSVSQVFLTVKDAIAQELKQYLVDRFRAETDWLYRQYPPPPDDGSDGVT